MTDNNRIINSTTYNFLNLAQQLHVNGKGNIQYVYDASGNRLQKIVVDSAGNKKTITTYIGGFIYTAVSTLTGTGNDTLQMISHEEGRIRWAFHKYTTGVTAYKYEYDYFVRDNQNNTRVILTQEKDTANYLATMEAAYRSTEVALFNNIPNSCFARNLVSGYPSDPVTSPNDSVAHLNGSGQKVGPSLLLKVMSGDNIDIAVHSFYTSMTGTGTNSSLTDVMNSLASGIVSTTSGGKGSVAQLTNPSGTLYSAMNSFITTNDPNPSGKPKAYLNWILLDDQLNPVSTYPQTGAIPVGNYTAGTLGTPGQTGIPITKSGFLYVWVSNETTGWDVYFDNLSVVHRTGPMLEENHYYPFGLAMAAISSKALKTNYYENKFRYNGGSELQNKEFADGSGLELYETPMRGYDAQIGRFGQIDPMATSYLDYSSYAYVTNNPILFSDPSGATKVDIQSPNCPVCIADGGRNVDQGGGSSPWAILSGTGNTSFDNWEQSYNAEQNAYFQDQTPTVVSDPAALNELFNEMSDGQIIKFQKNDDGTWSGAGYDNVNNVNFATDKNGNSGISFTYSYTIGQAGELPEKYGYQNQGLAVDVWVHKFVSTGSSVQQSSFLDESSAARNYATFAATLGTSASWVYNSTVKEAGGLSSVAKSELKSLSRIKIIGNVTETAARGLGVVSAIDHGIQAYDDFKSGDYAQGTLNAVKTIIDISLIFAKATPIGITANLAYLAFDLYTSK